MISAGRHKARAVEGALGMTGTGKEQVGVMMEITAGEHAGETITWYGFFTEKTIERTMESLRHMGWSGDDLSDLTGIDANEVTIVIEHETGDDGKERARVKWVNAGGGGLAMRDVMDADAAKAFAQRMKGAAIASRQAMGAPPAQRSNGGGQRGGYGSGSGGSRGGYDDDPGPDDRDIPF
jgi:hypothetical protein